MEGNGCLIHMEQTKSEVQHIKLQREVVNSIILDLLE